VILRAAVFGLMASSVVGRFGYFAVVNETTIEDLGKGSHPYYIAVRIDSSEIPRSTSLVAGEGPPNFWVVPYPFRPRVGPNVDAPQGRAEHLYAILKPRSGANPWDLGPYRNWKNIMGDHWWDWFLPLRYSPCTKHDSLESDFLLGHDFEELERTFLPHRYDDKKRRKLPLRI
jgi:palmitoyltransferase